MSKNFLNELKLSLPDLYIITADRLKYQYETDWRKKFTGKCIAVLMPTLVTEIQQIILICKKHKITITPQGGNTSTCGASVPTLGIENSIILNLSKMNKIIEYDKNNSSLVVESGCTLSQVQQFALYNNHYFPLAIASEGICQIGGNVATNAGGINVLKYGTMRDLILGIEAILPTGCIINQLSSLRKNNTNFDLKQLFIGSEGTLGIITKVALKLFPQPHNYFTFFSAVDNLNNALDLLQHIKEHNLLPNSFEIMNKPTQQVYNMLNEKKIPISGEWLILCEIEYNNSIQLDYIHRVIMQNLGSISEPLIATNESQRKFFWSIRENIPIAEKMYGNAIKFDISLPSSKTHNFVELNLQNLKNIEPQINDIIIFGHLGDGNLHYNIPLNNLNLSNSNIYTIQELVYNDVVNLGGSISAEHGIGQLKTKWFEKYYDHHSYLIAKSIKHLLDPDNILNPGKIFY